MLDLLTHTLLCLISHSQALKSLHIGENLFIFNLIVRAHTCECACVRVCVCRVAFCVWHLEVLTSLFALYTLGHGLSLNLELLVLLAWLPSQPQLFCLLRFPSAGTAGAPHQAWLYFITWVGEVRLGSSRVHSKYLLMGHGTSLQSPPRGIFQMFLPHNSMG